jgi:hypothetical protein
VELQQAKVRLKAAEGELHERQQKQNAEDKAVQAPDENRSVIDDMVAALQSEEEAKLEAQSELARWRKRWEDEAKARKAAETSLAGARTRVSVNHAKRAKS